VGRGILNEKHHASLLERVKESGEGLGLSRKHTLSAKQWSVRPSRQPAANTGFAVSSDAGLKSAGIFAD
jgi:hypothetical protein